MGESSTCRLAASFRNLRAMIARLEHPQDSLRVAALLDIYSSNFGTLRDSNLLLGELACKPPSLSLNQKNTKNSLLNGVCSVFGAGTLPCADSR